MNSAKIEELKGAEGRGEGVCLSYPSGEPFSLEVKLAVWRKAYTIDGVDPQFVRRDACGATIAFSDYGDRDDKYGWEIDHIVPVAKGGGDELSNLQPLHWKNNVAKSDGPLRCAVR